MADKVIDSLANSSIVW